MRPGFSSVPALTNVAPRAALVHDFFIQDGGAERCAVELASLLPAAPVHTTFFDARRFGDRIAPDRVRPWWPQKVLGPTSRFRALLPLYPVYYSLLRPDASELIVSSSVAFTKAVRRPKGAIHVTYVYTPMRYAWDLDRYLAGASTSVGARLAARSLRPILRRWDRATASRPDVVVAISETVRDRIRRVWRRDAELIHPPVDVAEIEPSTTDDGFLLVAARMLRYRRIDLVVEAARRLDRDLIVVGDGPERRRLEAMAGPRTRFPGHVPRAGLVELFRRCHAYVVTGVEDFGIAPVEALAAGKPVVAFAHGGALETVTEGRTGVFFGEPSATSLIEALERLEGIAFDPVLARAQAERFDVGVFRSRWRELLGRLGVDASLVAPG